MDMSFWSYFGAFYLYRGTVGPILLKLRVTLLYDWYKGVVVAGTPTAKNSTFDNFGSYGKTTPGPPSEAPPEARNVIKRRIMAGNGPKITSKCFFRQKNTKFSLEPRLFFLTSWIFFSHFFTQKRVGSFVFFYPL